MVRKVLLAGGILSSLLYVATTIVEAMRREGYSPASQAVSELSAIGAPSRPLVVPLFLPNGVLWQVWTGYELRQTCPRRGPA
jgi:hypothetical protein